MQRDTLVKKNNQTYSAGKYPQDAKTAFPHLETTENLKNFQSKFFPNKFLMRKVALESFFHAENIYEEEETPFDRKSRRTVAQCQKA